MGTMIWDSPDRFLSAGLRPCVNADNISLFPSVAEPTQVGRSTSRGDVAMPVPVIDLEFPLGADVAFRCPARGGNFFGEGWANGTERGRSVDGFRNAGSG